MKTAPNDGVPLGGWRRWSRRLGLGDRAVGACGSRWLVVDVESSGLDARRDRLLAIAAVAVHVEAGGRPSIVVGDSFEVVLLQADADAVADKANILLHGIGVGAQRAGVPGAVALADFERWVGSAPLVAFHAGFDRTLLDRAARRFLGHPLSNPWLDLADLAPVLQPGQRAEALDDWLDRHGIACAVRHQAAADAFATAELLLCLWPALQRQLPSPSFAQVVRLAAQRRWLPG